MEELKAELKKNLEIATDLFYRQYTEMGYKTLLILLDKLSEFMICLEKENIDGMYDEQIINLSKVLSESLKAMENNDSILLADMLEYDLKEILEDI